MSRVLVTGASKGIGQAIALRLAQDGFDIAVHFNKDEAGALKIAQSIKDLGRNANVLQFDVNDHQKVKEALESDIERNGCYYGLIVNAGITRDCAFPMMSKDDWDSVINTDLNGFYHVVNPCIMPMISARKGGRIIVITSVSGLMGNRGQVNYSAAKAGLIGAAKALSLEVAKRKITVNCIAPGLIKTDMTDLPEPVMKKAMELIPMQRMGNVQEVAHCASFLMSEDAGYITRQVISVNGGML